MGLLNWITSKIKGNGTIQLNSKIVDEVFYEVHIRELTFWSAVNIIANALSKCEFKTIIQGVEVRKDEYYLWNVEPNKNENSSQFIHNWVSKLLINNECLIIEEHNQLFVADTFAMNEDGIYQTTFTGVMVGNRSMNKTYLHEDVIYLKLSEKNMTEVTNALYNSYVTLLQYGMESYKKSRGTKGLFKYDTLPTPGTEDRKFFDDLINEKFKNFMTKANAIMPIGKGQAYEDIGSKTYSNDSTRDIRAMIDDISDFTCKSIGIPPVLLRGDVQDVEKAVEQLLTFCIDPLADLVSEELTRKRIGKKEYLKNSKIVINTNTIKHIDIFSITAAVDKLVASGCFCVNDIRRALGETPIKDEWANRYFMTKNYTSVEEMIKSIERGTTDE